MPDQPTPMPWESSDDEVLAVPQPLKPIGCPATYALLEHVSDVVMLYCACSDEPRALVHRDTIPVWQCAACGSHLFRRGAL